MSYDGYQYRVINPSEWTIKRQLMESFDNSAFNRGLSKNEADIVIRAWLASGQVGYPAFLAVAERKSRKLNDLYSGLKPEQKWWKPDFRRKNTA